MTLGTRIQALRKGQGLSQEELGEALGVSRQSVSKWEGDLTVPELDKLIAMGKLFHIPLGQLLGTEEEGAPPPDPVHARDRRRVRVLAALCGLLLLVCIASLLGTLHFRRELLLLLDPPAPLVQPVGALEYAVEPDHGDMTYDLALSMSGAQALKGWEVSLRVTTRLGREMEWDCREQTQLAFQGGACALVLEGLPFHYHRPILVELVYEKGELQGSQLLLQLEPFGSGGVWEVQSQVDALVEKGELLEGA